ncbi:RidA family protein [Halanaerobium salsuginis]|uniref:2-iminobutanoate/2-iminopropanoate deaminase n=1 Tax=Halanaerobium salsuginis TaxID=29563 RepID=A0A1I4K9L9_9FIRM|nr:RidA family protein [Halanaerobium salsuginis]SFL75454.1 2-iminobutanoate/2-iminopropanoate deaminase [Halanaerobium salsuginis]
MAKNIINSKQAPAAIGPYSQAVDVNGMLFISGQIPINPATGQLVSSDMIVQTKQVLDNLIAILEKAGYQLKDVVKTEIFLTDLDQFELVNRVYAEYFTAKQPARICVEVARLPRNVQLEIAALAVKES